MQRTNKARQAPKPELAIAEPKPCNPFSSRIWAPKKITPPSIDPKLPDLNGLQRSAEVLGYVILGLEWWLSPNGRLREWLRLNGRISAILLIPAMLVAPLVTLLLWQAFTWTVFLSQILGNVSVALVVLGCAAFILKAMRR